MPEGGNVNTTLTLPAIVVKLMSGTSSSSPGLQENIPTNAKIVLEDTACGVYYSTSFNGDTYSQLSSTEAALPVLSSSTTPTGASSASGILEYPGMPYATYKLCYDTGTKTLSSTTSFTNSGSGETETIYAGSATHTGTCTT